MRSAEQINKELRLILVNAILNSDNSEWEIATGWAEYRSPRTLVFIKNNVVIEVVIENKEKYRFRIENGNNFIVTLYTDSTRNFKDTQICLKVDGWSWNKEERNQRKLLNQKLESLRSYQELERYNLLPIKELRKAKLDVINNV
jgi:hypothetical protein